MERLTRQEEDVMRWIWQIEPCFIKDILAKYEEPKPPYTTLASIVKNLERKKYVKAKRYGNTYEYRDRKSTRLNSSHNNQSRMPSSA